jgi:hypothetical protein
MADLIAGWQRAVKGDLSIRRLYDRTGRDDRPGAIGSLQLPGRGPILPRVGMEWS